MRKFIVIVLFLALLLPVGAAVNLNEINFQTINARTFDQSLRGWFDITNTDIENSNLAIGKGEVFYVDSGSGSDNFTGQSKAFAKATIDSAIGECVANRGDVIIVMQGHDETEATAATSLFTLDVNGVSIIGVSNGNFDATVASGVITNNIMPTLVLDAADATITVSAKNCRISGFLIVSDIADVAVGLTVAATADGFMIDNCVFRDNGAALEYLIALSIATTVDNAQIRNNRFFTTAAAGSNSAIVLVGSAGKVEIVGNMIFGKYAGGALLGSAAPILNATITDNIIINSEAAAAITMHTSSTGVAARNFLGGTTSIAAAWTGNDAMWCYENQVSGTAGARGIPDPAADAD